MILRENCIKVGEVTKTHNLRGSVVVSVDGDWLERYADKPVFLLLEGAPVPFFIAEGGLAARNGTSCIVKFDYVDTLAQAEKLVGCDVLLPQEWADEGEEDETECDAGGFTGFAVRDLVSGKEGEVADVADYAGNVVLTLSISGREILLPLSEEYVCEIDEEHRQLQVRIPQELADLNGVG